MIHFDPTIIGVLGLAVGLITTIVKVAFRLGKLENQVGVLWDFLMRRAQVEAQLTGVVTNPHTLVAQEPTTKEYTMKEPRLALPLESLTLSTSAIEALEGLQGALRDFYTKKGRLLGERELFIEIERQFGHRLVQEVCLPLGLHAGACLVAAVAVCRSQRYTSVLPPS